ncbi:hypothetical protein APSETT444_008090 [Aspergillus pseudonomiae]
MHGFGIDLTSTPLPERLPQPVTLRQLDIFGDVPNGLLVLYPDSEVVKGQAMSDVSNPVHNAFLRVVKSSGRNDWVLGLPYHLLERHGGLEIAQLRNHKDQRKIRKANGDQYILVMEEFPAQLKCAKKLDDAHRIDLLIRGLVVESRLGDGLSMPRAVFVACKVGGLYASNSVMFAERALTGQETRPES